MLDLLHTFLTGYRAGTMTRAAETLGLSQPTVTAQLRTLVEEELRTGVLVDLMPTEDPPINTIYLATRAAGDLSGVRAALLEAARKW